MKSHTPQALRPSCSRKWRRPRSASEVATARPFDRPPTNASAPSDGLLTSTSPSFDPGPDSRVTGRPARAMNACASVRQWKPPWVGVLATTALPASACTSSACTCTLTG